MPKIAWNGECNRTPSDIDRCKDYTQSLWLPWLTRPQGPDWTPLAIVGGGPSIAEHEDELREWPGDVWAINGAFRWCKERGIRAAFFTIDPETYKHVERPSFEWVEKGDLVLIAPRVPEVAVNHCVWVGADIRLFETIIAHVTAATWAHRLSNFLGKADVSLFGCESSYLEGEASHAYDNALVRDRILVESNGEHFLTKPELLEQALYLSTVIREAPKYCRERSGGLLRAMVASGDYDIVKVAPWIMDGLTLVDDGTSSWCWKQSREKVCDWWKRGLGALSHPRHRPEQQSRQAMGPQ